MINFNFNDLSIGKKLFSGFTLLIIIMIAISGFGIYELKALEHNSVKALLTNNIVNRLDAARQKRLIYMHTGDDQKMKENGEDIQSMRSLLKEASKFTWHDDTRKKLEQLSSDIERYDRLRTDYYNKNRHSLKLLNELQKKNDRNFLTKLQDNLQDIAVDNNTRERIRDFLSSLSLLSHAGSTLIAQYNPKNASEFEALHRRTESLYTASLAQFPETIKSVLVPAWDRYQVFTAAAEQYFLAVRETQSSTTLMTEAADALQNTTSKLIDMQVAYNSQLISNAINVISLLSVLAVVIGLITAWAITRKITRPVSQNLALAQRISSGDLTAHIAATSKDELGALTETMAEMNTQLYDMISGIRESVSHVASASSQIAAGNTDLASRTEQQSAAVVETAASMEELTSTVRLNADNALQASHLAASASANARKGGEIVSEVVSTMNGIATSSKKITEIISVINGIAFQTNILALNAAVEAARAGEQGRGFAVVAGEVRTLAQRSADAAKEIESLINDSVARIGAGTDLVNKAGDSMGDIVQSVTHVSQIIDEISTSSSEQSKGIEQIGKAVTEMDSTTQQNASLVQESSAAAISLEHQAKKLSEMVAIFKTSVSQVHEGDFGGITARPPLSVPAITAKAVDEEWTSF